MAKDAVESIRLGITKPAGSSNPVILSIEYGGEQDFRFEIRGDALLGRNVRELAEAAVKDVEPTLLGGEERLRAYADTVRQELETRGFAVRDLPPGDVNLSFEYDAYSGLFIGSQEPLHDLAGVDEDLARRITASLKGIFNRGWDELVRTLQALLDAGDHIGAFAALEADRENFFFAGRPSPALLQALRRIDADQLEDKKAYELRRLRAAFADGGQDYELLKQDADVLLTRFPELPVKERQSLQNALGVVAVKQGRVETAIQIWRDLLRTPETLEASERGWAWRNLSMALDERDPEAISAARRSADAFLEGGDRTEAARSLGQVARLLEFVDARASIRQLDEIIEMARDSGLLERELKATVQHAKGRRLLELGVWEDALEASRAAAELRRGVTGVEIEFISSVNLAASAAEKLGRGVEVEEFLREAAALEQKFGGPWFIFGRRIQDLMQDFDAAKAKELQFDLRQHGDPELIALAETALASKDPGLTAAQRLERLENALAIVQQPGMARAGATPILLGLSLQLRELGEFGRAATWLRQLMKISPMDSEARDLLVDTLWQAKDWAGAASFLKEQMALRGKMPGLLSAYGRSVFEAGDLDEAVAAFTCALRHPELKPEMREWLRGLRDEALDKGGRLKAQVLPPAAPAAVTTVELEETLRRFSRFIAAKRRMEFWERDPNKGHKWVSKPEKLAQTLLHAALEMTFGERISVYSEIDAGAGRLDLLLRLQGGLSAIVELKMCGLGYSTSYAASGESQLLHYMENLGVYLGYLVVFDARSTLSGTPFFTPSSLGQYTVVEVPVDVRPKPPTAQQQSNTV